MRSMTGFGRGAASDAGLTVSVEISSVNRKNLDLGINLPRPWADLEAGVATLIRKRVARGTLRVTIQPEFLEGEAMWDDAAVAQTLKRLKALAEANSLPFEPDAHALFDIAWAHRETSDLPVSDEARSIVDQAVSEAVDAFCAMREREGRALAADLAERLAVLRALRETIATAAAGVVPDYRAALMERLRAAGLDLDLNDERVLKEIALFADRCDISEELTRLDSHLEQLAAGLESAEPVGRQLDFLMQEFLREFNTIGSKANSVEITKNVMAAKNELERIREQIQNVE